jgi:hypothetical protein
MNSISTIRPFAIGHRITVTHSITTTRAQFIHFQRTLSAVTRWCSSSSSSIIIIATATSVVIIACTTTAAITSIIIVCTTVIIIIVIAIYRYITSSTG